MALKLNSKGHYLALGSGFKGHYLALGLTFKGHYLALRIANIGGICSIFCLLSDSYHSISFCWCLYVDQSVYYNYVTNADTVQNFEVYIFDITLTNYQHSIIFFCEGRVCGHILFLHSHSPISGNLFGLRTRISGHNPLCGTALGSSPDWYLVIHSPLPGDVLVLSCTDFYHPVVAY